MSTIRYLDRAGKPLTITEWMALNDDRSYVQVGLAEVGEAEVSTIWLGLDHSFGGGQPIIFETLVFDGPLDGEGDRYSTLAEAEAGHARWVERVRSGGAGA